MEHPNQEVIWELSRKKAFIIVSSSSLVIYFKIWPKTCNLLLAFSLFPPLPNYILQNNSLRKTPDVTSSGFSMLVKQTRNQNLTQGPNNFQLFETLLRCSLYLLKNEEYFQSKIVNQCKIDDFVRVSALLTVEFFPFLLEKG